MAKKFNINSFLKLSPEEQAKSIERQTKELINRLPALKKKLKMYNETSDEMYNLSQEEVELQGMTYAKAIRSGEITTTSSKKAYRQFISNLRKYAKMDIGQLAKETAERRMDSWLEHIKAGSTDADSEYAQELFNSMTEEEKLGFTRSKYFMDSSYMYAVTEEDGKQYSIQTLKLELYLEEVRGKSTRHIYRTEVKGDESALRKYKRRK
ncbi:MAG: hypothetical protein J6S67_09780 [Methanobrevibacter sp.]|nr:hypothetical protein [Methanobrevibacter sp.]